MNLSIWKPERGSAAVEFALVIPILSLIVTGLIELGTLASTAVILHNAAREGARYAAVVNTCVVPSGSTYVCDPATAVVDYLTSALAGRTDVTIPTIAQVQAGITGCCVVGSPVSVSLQLPVTISVPLMQTVLGGPTVTLSTTAKMEVTQ